MPIISSDNPWSSNESAIKVWIWCSKSDCLEYGGLCPRPTSTLRWLPPQRCIHTAKCKPVYALSSTCASSLATRDAGFFLFSWMHICRRIFFSFLRRSMVFLDCNLIASWGCRFCLLPGMQKNCSFFCVWDCELIVFLGVC